MSNLPILFCALALWLGAAPPGGPEPDGLLHENAAPRARVFVVEDPRAVFAFNPDSEIVEEMVNRGITACFGKETPAAVWRSLVSTQDVVGLKVFSAPGATSGTRPAVAAAVVKGLLAAGIPPKHIVIWDKHLSDLRASKFTDLAERLGVEVAGSTEEGFDSNTFYESPLLGKLVWGDLEFGKKGDQLGRKSYVSKLLTHRLTKIINLTPLANHNLAQVSGNLYSLALGSVDNSIRFETGPNPAAALASAVPEIYAIKEVGDRVVLNIVDALICQYQGEEQTLLHYSTMLHQIRVSTDPVALDVLSIRELDRQRKRARVAPVRLDLQIYTNAALLELGTSDPRWIDVFKIDLGGKDRSAGDPLYPALFKPRTEQARIPRERSR